ncbi:hypothetical protein MPER_01014, partial [Moniliophthora perniciosa FA553]
YNVFSLISSWFALANTWLTYAMVIDLLRNIEHHPILIFGTAERTHRVNFVFKFILALGNRPTGERTAYAITLCLCLLVDNHNVHGKALSYVNFFFTSSMGSLVAALLSTFGIYFISSFLYGDPWHMFSSLFQYLLLAPSFTNVLNVYAFCNLHDVSWGTKGSDKAEALPSLTSSKPKGSDAPVVEDTTKPQEDVDEA